MSLLVVFGYVARPVADIVALNLEVLPPGESYSRFDPHGFGMMMGVTGAAVLAMPVLWLLLQPRVAGREARRFSWVFAILVIIATPMLLHIHYFWWVPLEWGWPVVTASTAWFVLVMVLCLHRQPGWPSAHGALDRYPRVAVTVLALIGTLKLGALAYGLVLAL